MPRVELPSRQQVNELATQALGLVQGEENRDPYAGSAFDEYGHFKRWGGLETAVVEHVVDDKIVHIGTLQDWEGTQATPDFHIVVSETLDAEIMGAKEFIYQFIHNSALFSRFRRYNTTVSEVMAIENGEVPRMIPISGQAAIQAAQHAYRRDASMKLAELRLLAAQATNRFDIPQYLGLRSLLENCGPDNRLSKKD